MTRYGFVDRRTDAIIQRTKADVLIATRPSDNELPNKGITVNGGPVGSAGLVLYSKKLLESEYILQFN